MKFVVERLGARIVRCGFGGHQPLFGGVVEVVPGPVDLPAYWDGEKAVPLPPAPASHDFDYEALQWRPNPAAALYAVRKKRDILLAKSDWRVTKSMEDGKPMTKEWKDYRQALRDITQQADPFNVVWPLEPE